MLRIDLHCHTCRSYDGWTSPAELIQAAERVGLDRVCVTDHGTLQGAFEARDLAPHLIIPGIEIRCAGGTELLGIWIEQPVPDGLSPEETAARIRDLGGLVYAPHPFAYPRKASWHAHRALSVADLVEVFNPRAFLPAWNRRAAAAASQYDRPAVASSDAHFPREIGRGATEVAPFHTPAELLTVLRKGLPIAPVRPKALPHVLSVSLGIARKLGFTIR